MINYSRIVRNADGNYVGATTDWAAENPVLPLGAIGIDTTARVVKIGNGTNFWTSLPIFGSGAGTGDLLAANNLADVASAATARANLGLSQAATHQDYAEWLLNGSPSGTFRSSFPRRHAASTLAALTSGVMTSVALYLEAGDIITSLTAKSVAAAVTPTSWWLALYGPQATPALIGQTADQGSAAWGANTTKTLPLGSPYAVPVTGIYYVGIMVAATTPPTLIGLASLVGATGWWIAGGKALAMTSGSGLTSTAPATIASSSATGSVPYVIAT